MYKNTRLFMHLSSIIGFSKQLRLGVPCKVKTYHALSHKQYLSKHRFLDFCRCAFKFAWTCRNSKNNEIDINITLLKNNFLQTWYKK